jgi:hypothetical protein
LVLTLLTQNPHLAPCTQQTKQASLTHEWFQSVLVNFSWKLTKDKIVRCQSLELAGWYQTVPYLRLESHVRWHIAMRSYLSIRLETIREL